MSDSWQLPILILVGILAGGLNVIAGGGSFLTLPILIWMGIPPTVANGTNRLGILIGNFTASWLFWRKGLLRKADLIWSVAPAMLGGGLGALLASRIDDRSFTTVFTLLMVGVSLYTLRDSEGGLAEVVKKETIPKRFLIFGFSLVGVYAGFVQAGTGFFSLAVTTAAGLSLMRGNAVKVVMNLCLTVVALSVFAAHDMVDWRAGWVFAIGMLIGSQIGVRLTVLKGNRFIKRVVTITIVGFAVALLVRLFGG